MGRRERTGRPKSITTIYIDMEVKKSAKDMKINISQVAEEALLDKIFNFKRNPVERPDPFANEEVRLLLPAAKRAIERDKKFARGWSRRIYNITGHHIPPDVLMRKLGVEDDQTSV